jgi:hypothetical protein
VTSGAFNSCPPPTGQCNTNTSHFGDLRVWLPHGRAGINAHVQVPPTTDVGPYLQSYDFSPSCDPIFGDPSDPECIPQASGGIQCSQTAFQFAGTGGNTPPPPIGHAWSEWVGSYSGSYVIENQTFIPPNIYEASISCAAVNTCRPPTAARCAPPLIEGVAIERGSMCRKRM